MPTSFLPIKQIIVNNKLNDVKDFNKHCTDILLSLEATTLHIVVGIKKYHGKAKKTCCTLLLLKIQKTLCGVMWLGANYF